MANESFDVTVRVDKMVMLEQLESIPKSIRWRIGFYLICLGAWFIHRRVEVPIVIE